MAQTQSKSRSVVATPIPPDELRTTVPNRVGMVLIRAATRVLEAEGALRRLSSDWIDVRTSPRS